MSREEYDQKYLAMDDKGCFEAVLAACQRPHDKGPVKRLIHRKMALYRTLSEKELLLYPGVVAFVRKAEGNYRLAIASGAFRGEIRYALEQGEIQSAFPVIVSAQDVRQCKPHPEAFLTALSRINAHAHPLAPILPSETVVIEDSIHGVEAARSAGMRCLAVTNSYSREILIHRADRVVDSLLEVSPSDLAALCL